MLCARQEKWMGDNPTLIVSLGFAIYLVAMFSANYCPVFCDAFIPLKSQTMIYTAEKRQQEGSSPSAGERMG